MVGASELLLVVENELGIAGPGGSRGVVVSIGAGDEGEAATGGAMSIAFVL